MEEGISIPLWVPVSFGTLFGWASLSDSSELCICARGGFSYRVSVAASGLFRI